MSQKELRRLWIIWKISLIMIVLAFMLQVYIDDGKVTMVAAIAALLLLILSIVTAFFINRESKNSNNQKKI